jgi:hypothetical protein
MTTYTLNAIKVVYADIGEGIDAFDYVTLSIVAPESSGFVFSYDNVVVGRPFINTQLEDSSDPTSANFYGPFSFRVGSRAHRCLSRSHISCLR